MRKKVNDYVNNDIVDKVSDQIKSNMRALLSNEYYGINETNIDFREIIWIGF